MHKTRTNSWTTYTQVSELTLIPLLTLNMNYLIPEQESYNITQFQKA